MSPFVAHYSGAAAVEKAYRKTTGTDSYVTTPAQTAFDLGSDEYEIRVRVNAVTYEPAGVLYITSNYYTAAGVYYGWDLRLHTTGTVRFYGTYDDQTDMFFQSTSVIPSALDGVALWISARKSGTTVTIRYSEDASSWTTIGTWTSITKAVESAAGVPFVVGALQSTGSLAGVGSTDSPLDIMRAQLWTGGTADTGTLIVNFDATQAATGTPASFVATTGETWTFTGSNWSIAEL